MEIGRGHQEGWRSAASELPAPMSYSDFASRIRDLGDSYAQQPDEQARREVARQTEQLAHQHPDLYDQYLEAWKTQATL